MSLKLPTEDILSSGADTDPRLQRLNRLATLGMLSAGAAHEIKNALVPVKTFVDLLIEQDPESELAGIVRQEISRINQLVAHMLKLSGPGRARFVPVSLHRTIEDSLRLLRHHANGKSVLLNQRLEAIHDQVLGDANQLQQVLLNLLINALDAMGQSGSVCVSTQTLAEGQIEVAVADTGLGIVPENMGQLFHPFFTTKEGGTGLGLAIARDIVTAHNGTLTVESQPGQGATFLIRIPHLVPDKDPQS